jgi:hypothetical protein
VCGHSEEEEIDSNSTNPPFFTFRSPVVKPSIGDRQAVPKPQVLDSLSFVKISVHSRTLFFCFTSRYI